MREVVFLLEEESAKVLIEGIITKIRGNDNKEPQCKYIVFEGKRDLQKKLFKKLNGYCNQEAVFIIMQDQDSEDCKRLKQKLDTICKQSNKCNYKIRILCRELESWYLADLEAIEKAFGVSGIAQKQRKKKFRNPDELGNPAYELKKLIPGYQKIMSAREIAPFIDIQNTRSRSFHNFIKTITEIV